VSRPGTEERRASPAKAKDNGAGGAEPKEPGASRVEDKDNGASPAEANEHGASRAEAKERSRQRLLDGALEILEEEGEGALTTTAVAGRAGLVQSAFYTHFSDMDELLAELIRTVERERRVASVSAGRAGGQKGRGRNSLRETVLQTAAHPNLFRLLLRSRLDGGSKVGAEAHRQREKSRRHILQSFSTFEVPMDTSAERRQAEMMADSLLSAREGLIVRYLDGGIEDIEELVHAYRLVTRGVVRMARSGGRSTSNKG
jgi:TetR/AcrR family transcriptional regulator, fatty acid biosynthesis regulator